MVDAGATSSATVALLLITIIYIILGCFMDAMSIILLTVPILYPVIIELGINPIQFGVVAVMTLAIGAITPPYGIVVFAMSNVARDVPVWTIFRGAANFIIAMIICEVVVIFWPPIATFLPGTMMK